MKTALFIGRFQPFHSGHYSVLQHLVRQGFTHCVIGIGSSQYQRTLNNPLSYDERLWSITTVLQAHPLALHLTYCAIPDIHDDAAWVAHVDKLVYNITPHYDVVVSGNSVVQALFTQAQMPVQSITMSISVSGTQLRAWIRQDDPRWRAYLDPTIADVIVPIIKSAS